MGDAFKTRISNKYTWRHQKKFNLNRRSCQVATIHGQGSCVPSAKSLSCACVFYKWGWHSLTELFTRMGQYVKLHNLGPSLKKKIDMIVNVKEIQSWKGAHGCQLQPRPTFPHGKSSYYIYFKPGEGRAVASFMSLCHWACAWLYFPSPADTSAGRLARRTCFVCSLRDDHGRGSEGSAQPPECAQRLQNQISARGKTKAPRHTFPGTKGKQLDCVEP